MNNLKMYLIFDVIANRPAGEPFFQPNDVTALRSIKNTIGNNEHFQARQFELYYLAELNTNYDFVDTNKRRVCSLSQIDEMIDDYLKSQGV